MTDNDAMRALEPCPFCNKIPDAPTSHDVPDCWEIFAQITCYITMKSYSSRKDTAHPPHGYEKRKEMYDIFHKQVMADVIEKWNNRTALQRSAQLEYDNAAYRMMQKDYHANGKAAVVKIKALKAQVEGLVKALESAQLTITILSDGEDPAICRIDKTLQQFNAKEI